MNKRIASAVVGASLVFGLAVGCTDKASNDFKARCDKANGEVVRESETLGMDAIAFVVKNGGSKSSKSKSKKSKSSDKLSGGHSKPKKSKKSKHDDDEWVCARNGVELFEES